MTKRRLNRRYNNFHYYDLGSWINKVNNKISSSNFGKSVGGSNGISSIINGASSLINTANPNKTVAGNLLQGIGSVASSIPGIGGIVGAGLNLVGGAVNSLFGSSINDEAVDMYLGQADAQKTFTVNASSSNDFINQANKLQLLDNINVDDIGSEGIFSNRVSNKVKEINDYRNEANNQAISNLIASKDSFNKSQILQSQSNLLAGGGKIHIKKANRGKFTKYCGGKVTSACIAKGKRSSDPAVRKRAVFAQNARKFKHAFGGDLLTHGAEWDNGLKMIGNGGTHEENPMEGVPMGIAPDGQSNLVEEGEVIFNDYVFSNRMTADKDLLEAFNLPKSYDGYSFAAIAERLGKESEERPNDPISKRGLMSSMTRLQQAQETMRQKNQAGQKGIQYSTGGKLNDIDDDYTYTPVFGDFKSGNLPEVTVNTKMPNMIKYVNYNIPSTVDPLEIESFTPSTLSYIKDSDDEEIKSFNPTWLRYAPVVGAAIGLGQNLFSKPDYTSADAILEAADKAGNYTPIEYSPIGNYLTYKPFDRNYYINKLNAQAGATRRAILNTTSPSRNAALLAADYNALGRLGDLARQAEEYNLAQRQAVETFNRGTNMTNSEMGLKAAMANQEAALKARSSRLSGVAQAMAMRDAIDNRRSAGISTNLTNLFDSLGNIGIDAYNRADRDMLIKSGVFGTLSQKPQEWSNKRWEDYKKALNGTGYSKGGKLKKRRGGLTY